MCILRFSPSLQFTSKDSRVSNGSKSSKSSSSSRRKVEIAERRQGPVARGVLTQPGKIQSAKLPHKTVAFAEHSAQSSIDSNCTQTSSQISWTNSFNKQLKQSSNPINLEDFTPPLPPKRKGNSQPHPLNLTTNSYTNMFPRRNSDLWENGFEVTHPVNLISHKKSKSDELSDHYSTVFDIIPDQQQSAKIKSGGSSSKLNSNFRSKHKVRSKSSITFLTQKLSPTKVKAPEIPKPIPPPPLPDIPNTSYDEYTLASAMFTNIQGRIPSPEFFEHQHTDSVQSQQTSSLSSAC
ncbi:hypothetical protein LOD99_4943 [Oopsacas minuta]|uniref:Uncharacterized protein n=1 Tax=Oopsacas minuta TaxID=111878 RepID=A0AAV7JTG2_9METZ|nr:hypothetical protein LOD99_4943 [Oopsacas minuta]